MKDWYDKCSLKRFTVKPTYITKILQNISQNIFCETNK